MWHIIILFVFSLFFVLGIIGSFTKKSAKTITSIDSTATSPSDTIKGKLSKSLIKEKLQQLAKSDAPTELSFGAMCYEMAMRPSNAHYICPICGTKTLYTQNYADFVEGVIPYCRALIDSISYLDIKLDETQFCRKCGHGKKDPSLCITIKYPDDTLQHSVCNIDGDDLKLMNEFIRGKDKHKGERDSEISMKSQLERLKVLFDIKDLE
jgi:hypothetical protein